jgi:O-antigen/teichoic acid export membrane protein
METAFFRFFTKEKEKGKVISTTFISLIVTTLLFLIISLYFSTRVSAFFGFSNPLYFKLLILTLVLDTLVVIPYAYLRVTNRPVRFAFFKISNVVVFAILTLFFLWIVPKNNIHLPAIITNNFGEAPQVIYVFLAGVIASFMTFLFMLPITLKFKLSFDKHIFKKLLIYGLPIMIGGLAYATNENLDKLLLPNYLGDSQMGIYAACYKLGVFMTLFIMAFRLGAEPFFFNQADKKNAKESYAKILTWFTIIGAVFMFVIIAYMPLFAKIIIGKEEYLEALKIVPIILLANLILGIYNNLSVWYKLTDKTKFGMYFSITGAVITIALNIIFIPIFGYMASAWITLIAYLSMTLLSYFYGKKHYPVPYNIRKVSFYIIISIVLSMLSYSFFKGNYYVSSILFILFVGIIYLLEKRTIKSMLF